MPGRTPSTLSASAPLGAVVVLTLAVVALAPRPAAAATFAPITDGHRSLTEAPGYPEAPAVTIFRNGRFTMMGALTSESYSSLVVEGRIKLLSEGGSDYGEVVVPHTDFIRLVSFEGRTVLPDGTEVRLPDDALFRETVTGEKSWYRTKATFPALEPGAILDYRYEIRFETVSELSPWYFQSDLPTLHSEITFYVPGHVSAQPWGKATFGRQFQSSQQRTAQGTELKVWMDGLPPVPDEPSTLPYEDLSSSFLLLPTSMVIAGDRYLLFEDWKAACDLVDYVYSEARRRDGRTRSEGKRIAREAGPDPEDKARRIFAFVRDEIATVDLLGVTPKVGDSLDDMLREQRADVAGKALLLEAMLDAARLRPDLVWAADRRFGVIDTSVANPNWFEAVLVRVELGGEEVFLDPSDRGYGFGYLRAGLEGMDAVVYSRKKPEVIRLPERSYEANARHARLDLEVDEEGRFSGTGSLTLEGHYGASWFVREPAAVGRVEALTTYLEEALPRFEVSQVSVEDDVDAPRIEVRWTLAARDEEVLGDEVSLEPSAPLGPVVQRFALAPIERQTPVLLSFADRDDTEVTVTWPEGWAADVVPEETTVENRAGVFATRVGVDDAARTLKYRRRFDTVAREFDRIRYGDLRALYGAASASDEQELVLVLE